MSLFFIESALLMTYHNDQTANGNIKGYIICPKFGERGDGFMDAVILAGGENTRIPVPKGLLTIHGRHIIDRNAALLGASFDRIFLSTNTPEFYFHTGLILIGDRVPGKGPMTGICTVLIVPGVSAVFVTACDMPYINVILIQYLIERWNERVDALIPIYCGKPEPLFGIYSGKIAGVMEDSLRKGERSLQAFLRKVNVQYVEEEEVRKRDPAGKTFVNINTLEDYQRETGGEACSG